MGKDGMSSSKKWYWEHREQDLARQKIYRERNKEKIAEHKNEYMKEYYEKNKKKIAEYQHEWYLRNAEKRREQERKRRELKREEINAKHREYRKKNKEKIKEYRKIKTGNAVHTFGIAIARGKVHKQPCEICGVEPAEAHHDDYNKPLEVRWLCKNHHSEWHRDNEPIYYKEDKYASTL